MFDRKHAYIPRSPGRTTPSRCIGVFLLLGMLISGGISGCATSSPARPAGMTPQDLPLHRSHPYSIRVETDGGQETDPKGPSQISNQAFAQALSDAIRESRLFDRVVLGRDTDYLLKVAIVQLEQSPPKGFSMTARMEADWALLESNTGTPVWTDTIASSYTASAISSRKAVTRMRLATEGAARENIRQGMERISRLALE